MNTHTFFSTQGEAYDAVDNRLSRVIAELNVCSNCINGGSMMIRNCKRENSSTACFNCIATGCHCYSLFVSHVFSDMAKTQVKAHRLRNERSHTESSGLLMPTHGFGYLHMAKSLVASCRNNHITDGTGEFCILDLTALHLCDSSPCQIAMRGVTHLIHSFKDRQSDELARQTLSLECENALSLAVFTKVTLVPEQYHRYRAINHNLLKRPLFVCCTRAGRFMWSDADSEMIGLGDRHNPVNIQALCDADNPGEFTGRTCKINKAKLKVPLGLAIVSVDDKREHLVVCNSGKSRLLILCNVHDLTNKSCSWMVPSWSKSGCPNKFHPFAICSAGFNRIVVVDKHQGLVHIISVLGESPELRVDKTVTGFVRPTSVASFVSNNKSWVIVVTQSGVKLVSLCTENMYGVLDVSDQVPKSSLFGAAVSNAGVLCLTVPSNNQCLLFSIVMNSTVPQFNFLLSVGDGSPGTRDGCPQFFKLNEPCGVSARDATFLVCCIAGDDHGYICRINPTEFAQRYIAQCRGVFDGGMYIPLKFKHHKDYVASLTPLGIEGTIAKFESTESFLTRMETNRR